MCAFPDQGLATVLDSIGIGHAYFDGDDLAVSGTASSRLIFRLTSNWTECNLAQGAQRH